MVKPNGPACNCKCQYCYYLPKACLYPDSRFRMTGELLNKFTRQYIESQNVSQITFAWQGGEPTLMGLDFYKQVIQIQLRYKRPDLTIINTFQTNGLLLDDEWCRFFKKHDFLIGISIDGPKYLHDIYRVDAGNHPTAGRVLRGIKLLKKHGVEFNTLTCVHAANADHPLEVYRFLRDDIQSRFIQFIPIVLKNNETMVPDREAVTNYSVSGRQYGNFLKAIFDEWVRRDVGRIFVQTFEAALAAWVGQTPGVCIYGETCGSAMVLEHNGDLYSCDHFVEPGHLLGNINNTNLTTLIQCEKQQRFGQAKRDTLPRYCQQCSVRFVCNGECPKNRILNTPDGEPGLNYLCEGYQAFFKYVDPYMKYMAGELTANRAPANIMQSVAKKDMEFKKKLATTGRNDPCPCGSGLKYKRCHGRLIGRETIYDISV